MAAFSLLDYCHNKHFKFKSVKIWLLLYFRDIQILKEEQSEDKILEIKMAIGEGEKRNFAVEKLPEKVKSLQFIDYLIKKEQKKLTFKRPENFPQSEAHLQGLNSELSLIEGEIFSLYKSEKSLNIGKINNLHLEKSRLLIEKEKLEQIIGQVDLNEKERDLAENKLKQYFKTRNQLFQSLPPSLQKTEIAPQKSVETENNTLLNKIKTEFKLNEELTNLDKKNDIKHNKSIKTAEIPWSNITFGEKYIWIKLDRKFFKRYPMDRSRIAFNQIKEIYNNRNLPRIKIEYSGGNVTKILNIDVLFYFFLFLENTGQDFTVKDIPEIIRGYSHFTKSFYQKNLRQLFTPRCFNHLIDICSDHLPIVPIPERVINSAGIESVDDSFLFPIRKEGYYLWIWESIEEKKATYIFKTTSENYLDEVQNIYDFLTSELQNKRFRLIRDKISTTLPLIKRIKHTDFNDWKYQIKLYTNLYPEIEL